MQETAELLAEITVFGAFGASLLTLAYLFARHLDGRRLIAYQPRRSVPWSGWPVALLMAPMLLSFADRLASFAVDAPEPAAVAAEGGNGKGEVREAAAEDDDNSSTAARETALMAVTMIMFALTVWAGLAALTGATRGDLGWPRDGWQFWSDVGIGAAAFLAALAPIYLLQWFLWFFLEVKEGHPFVEEFERAPSSAFMAAIAVAAVVAAPLFEETAFRLVFLGWLEKIELRGLRPEAPSPPASELLLAGSPTESKAADPPAPEPVVEFTTDPSPTGGWFPIIATGLLFGVAHWGQGVAPVPLAFLGIVLGYLYHRTHRIVPSIACHLLFNAFSMWLMLLQYLGE